MIPDFLVNQVIRGRVKQAIIEFGSGKLKPLMKKDKISLRYTKGTHPCVRRIEFAKAELAWINRIWFFPDQIQKRKGEVIKKVKLLNQFAKKSGFKNWDDQLRFMLDKHDLPKEFYLIGWRQIEFTFEGE